MSPSELIDGVPDSAEFLSPILIRGRSGMISVDFEDKALGSATVRVVNDAGTEVIASIAATGAEGKFTYVIPAAKLTALDLLTATWMSGGESVTTHAEVAGGYVVSLADIEEAAPANVTDINLRSARLLAETALEDACYVSFVPRFRREVLDGVALERGRLRVLRELKVNGSAVSSTSSVRIVDRRYIPKGQFFNGYWGGINDLLPASMTPQIVEVAYEHGYDTPPPLVARAVTRLAAFFLTEDPSNYDQRATSISTDEAHYSLITPGLAGAVFALPEVNAVVQRYGLGPC